MNQGHKILVLFSFLIVFIGISYFSPLQKSSASATDNVQGFAWTDTIGWISFNCSSTGACPPNGPTNHGVALDLTTGNITGYAWSDNIGWIKFDPTFTGPGTFGGNQYGAKFFDSGNGAGKVKGWARACTAFQNQLTCSGQPKVLNGPSLGGWDGWISFDCSDDSVNGCISSNYGVTYDSTLTPGEFSGFAWGSMFVGWISFNHKDMPSTPSNYVVTGPTKNSGPNLTCFNNKTSCPTPNINLEVKESSPATLPYGSSVTLNSTGGNVDLNWSNDAQGIASSSLICDLTSTNPWFSQITNNPGSGTSLSQVVPANNTTSNITTTITITCDDGFHTIVPVSVTITVPPAVPTGQTIQQVILEAASPSGGTFSINHINIPTSPGKIDLQWSIIYSNPNNPGLDVVCDGNSNPNSWVNWFLAPPPPVNSNIALNNHPYTTPGTTNATVSGTATIPFNLICYDRANPNATVQSNTINVSFGLDPIVYLDIKDDAKSADPFSTTVVNFQVGGGWIDLQVQGSNINFCTATSSSTGSEDSDWKSIMTNQINPYLQTLPVSILYPTPPAIEKIHVIKSTTFGIQCQQTSLGTKITTLKQVQVWVDGIKSPTLTPPKPKYIFF